MHRYDWRVAILTGPLLVEVLLAALGVAVNPPAVIASIMLVASSRGRAIAFAGGWIAGLLLVGSVVALLGDVTALLGEPSKTRLIAKLVVGIALVALGASQWLKHRSASTEQETPAWMRSLDNITAPRAFLMAAAYALFNPKTVAFVVAGALTIVDASLGAAAEWAALALFVVLASLTVTAPVAFAVLAPQSSAESLVSARRWLSDNGSILTAAALGVLGVVLVYSGITGLTQL